MIHSVVQASLRFRVLVLAAAAGLVFLGASQLPSAKVDTLPEFMPPQVTIQTEALGLSAAEVEQLVTVPLEADLLNGVAWLDEIRSESVPGLSSIELVFEPGTDILHARQVVAERLTQAHALPAVAKPPAMLQPLSSTSRVMMVGLSSDELSLMDLSVLARWTIKPRLTGVAGVANVAVWGQRERQLQVQVDPVRLQENGVTLAQVMRTTGNALWVSPLSFVEASTPGSGGFIETPTQRMGVQHISPISTAADLSQVTVEDTVGRTLRLGDVANVVESNQPLIGDAVVDDAPSLMLVVEKFPGASTLEVTAGLEEAFAALAPGLPGVTIDTSLYHPATTIEDALERLGVALLIGFGLLVLLLWGFLRDWRATLIGAVAVPLPLLVAGVVLQLRDATFTVITAAGLLVAVGVVIDDVVTDLSAVRRRIGRRGGASDDRSADEVIAEAAFEVRRPSVLAVVVVGVAATPLLFLDDLTGAFTRPLLLSYALAVLASMLVGLTLTPVLAHALLAKRGPRRESPFARWAERRYDSVLSRTVGQPRPVMALVGLSAAGVVVLVPMLGPLTIVPRLHEQVVLIQWDGAPGTAHPEMARITAAATRELRAVPGVREVGAHIGRAITSDQVVNVNAADLWVTIESGADRAAVVSGIGDVVDGYPGLFREVQTYPEQQLRRAETGADADVVVRVFGPDAGVLADKAAEVRDLLAGIDGVVTPRIDTPAEEPTIEIQVDLAAAERHAIKPGDVRRAAATLVSGVEVGSLFEEQKVFEVVVWGAPEIRHSLGSMSDMLIDKPDGGHVRLGDVADVSVTGNPNVIMRDAVSRRVDVSADVTGRDLGTVLADVDNALGGVDFPLEYRAEVLDEQQDAGLARVAGLVVAAALGVFLLLQLGLGSWRLAALVLLALPVALIGGLLAAFLAEAAITLAAVAGLLTVLAIATRNALLSIEACERLPQERGGDTHRDAVRRASVERMAPIVLGALGIAAALVPLAVLGGSTGLEVIRPAIVVVLGGVLTSALFSLFVVPTLYLRFAARSDAGRSSSSGGPAATHVDPHTTPTGRA